MLIDHIGIVVRSLEDGIKQWTTIFEYMQMTEVVVNTRQKVKVVFLSKEGSLTVKLIEPTGEDSPVFAFARKGGGLHHLCFKTDDLESELVRLRKKGLRVIAQPQPGDAFDNEKIAFLFAKHGLNIEVIDTDKRASRLPISSMQSGVKSAGSKPAKVHRSRTGWPAKKKIR